MSECGQHKKTAHIWVLAHELGFDGNNKDMLYEIVRSVSGGNSISALTTKQKNEVIGTLIRIRMSMIKEPKRQDNSVGYLPSPEQRRMVEAIMNTLCDVLALKSKDAYLESICKRTFSKSYRQLNATQVQSLIEALKSILQRKATPAGGEKSITAS